jgi:hypothetical protein
MNISRGWNSISDLWWTFCMSRDHFDYHHYSARCAVKNRFCSNALKCPSSHRARWWFGEDMIGLNELGRKKIVCEISKECICLKRNEFPTLWCTFHRLPPGPNRGVWTQCVSTWIVCNIFPRFVATQPSLLPLFALCTFLGQHWNPLQQCNWWGSVFPGLSYRLVPYD